MNRLSSYMKAPPAPPQPKRVEAKPLPPHNPNSEVAKRELREIQHYLNGQGGLIAGCFRHVGGKGPDDDHKEWAKVLKVRELSGEHLSLMQRQAWREALGESA